MFEKQENLENQKEYQGISFETELGNEYSNLIINFPDEDKSLRDTFTDKKELEAIIENIKDFRNKFKNTFNGKLLGNPKIILDDGNNLSLSAEKIFYHVYFAAHKLRKQNKSNEDKYVALSTCGIIYDDKKMCFYLSIRPEDSQEEPGMIDAPGGVLNPNFENADPQKIIEQSFEKKLGLKPEKVSCIGLERIMNNDYSLYNIAMYAKVNNTEPSVNKENYKEIYLKEIEEYLINNNLTQPAKATLLLALSLNEFNDSGWGKNKVGNFIKTHK